MNELKMLFWFLIFFVSSTNCAQNDSSTGILTVSMSDCDIEEPLEAEDVITCYSSLSQNDTTLILSGEVALFEDLDDSIKYDLEVNSFNGHKLWIKGTLCNDLHDVLPDFWRSLTEAAGVPSECPIPAGEYHVEDFFIGTKDWDLSRYIKGKVLLKVFVVRNQKQVLCREFLLHKTVE